MSHNLLLNSSFHIRLRQIDWETTQATREKGCPFCSGPLHQANYPRTVFGLPPAMRHHHEERFSLCCGHCRKRTTPPSVRFLGARRFLAFVFVLVCAQRTAPHEKRLERLFLRFGLRVSLSTWQRWRQWWKNPFPVTSVWRALKGLLVHHDRFKALPRDVFKALTADRLVSLLRLISPLGSRVI